MSDKVPLMYSLNLTESARKDPFDVFELFMASLCGLVKNCSKRLDLAIFATGWKNWQFDAVRVVCGDEHDVRFIVRGNELYDRVSDLKKGIDTHSWCDGILDKMAIREVFPSYGWAFYSDSDVIFRDDVSKYMHEDERVFVFAVPDGWQAHKISDGERDYRTDNAYMNGGFMLCNLRLFPPMKELVDFYWSKLEEPEFSKVGFGVATEQDTIALYALENGLKIRAMPPNVSVCDYCYRGNEFRNDESVFTVYANMGMKISRIPTSKDVTILHLVGDKDKTMYGDIKPLYDFCKPSIDMADRIIDGCSLSYPMVEKPFARKTDVVHRTSPNRPALEDRRYRTVVYSNSGSDRWRSFLLPSVLSVVTHTKRPLRFIIMEDRGDTSSNRERDELESVVGEGHVVEYREADLDLSIFANNRWSGVNLHKLFMHDLLGDIDDYCLFMDSDVMVIDDLEPLFSVCDVQPTKDKVLGTLNWFHFTDRHPIPVQLSGGFFFMHPNGYEARYVSKRLFTSEWHDNDEYVIGECTSPEDFVNLANASIEAITEGVANGKKRRDELARNGVPEGRVFAVHFLSSAVTGRFNRRVMRKDFRKYVDDWNMYVRMSGQLSRGDSGW